jgi:hypothetical protein
MPGSYNKSWLLTPQSLPHPRMWNGSSSTTATCLLPMSASLHLISPCPRTSLLTTLPLPPDAVSAMFAASTCLRLASAAQQDCSSTHHDVSSATGPSIKAAALFGRTSAHPALRKPPQQHLRPLRKQPTPSRPTTSRHTEGAAHLAGALLRTLPPTALPTVFCAPNTAPFADNQFNRTCSYPEHTAIPRTRLNILGLHGTPHPINALAAPMPYGGFRVAHTQEGGELTAAGHQFPPPPTFTRGIQPPTPLPPRRSTLPLPAHHLPSRKALMMITLMIPHLQQMAIFLWLLLLVPSVVPSSMTMMTTCLLAT